jgi:hypothetical protein
MRTIPGLIIAMLLAAPASGADLHGWVLSAPEPEENVYIDQEIWTLTPPDGRPATSLRASVAARVNNGSLPPEAAYLGRDTGPKSDPKSTANPEENPAGLAGRAPASPTKGLGLDSAAELAQNQDPADPAAPSPPPAPAAPAWDPDGKTKPYYDYEKTKLACQKAHKASPLSGTKTTFEERQPWNLPEGNTVASCKDADLEELMRREAYDTCSPIEAAKIGAFNQGGTLEAWVSKQQTWASPHGEIATAYGIYVCKSGRHYEAFMKLGEYDNECWMCSMQASYSDDIAGLALKKAKLEKVDLNAGPRTSPHESEYPERAAYWP